MGSPLHPFLPEKILAVSFCIPALPAIEPSAKYTKAKLRVFQSMESVMARAPWPGRLGLPRPASLTSVSTCKLRASEHGNHAQNNQFCSHFF